MEFTRRAKPLSEGKRESILVINPREGASIYDVRKIKFWDFLTTPPSLVMYRNQLVLFLSSAFWGPPLSADVIYGSPRVVFVESYLDFLLPLKLFCALRRSSVSLPTPP